MIKSTNLAFVDFVVMTLCLLSVDVDVDADEASLVASLANDVFDCDTVDDLDVVSDVFEPKADLKNLVTLEPPLPPPPPLPLPPALPPVLPVFSSSKNYSSRF